ncbi:MAG TPA: YbaK/EbsC family protein, partial [Stellaceae bacterium]|nr:YbaK/EbsC family protein [Stellaceae bacterium]
SAELLYEVLGVQPGSVTPYAAINDTASRVTVVLQRAMLTHDPLNYHPLENTRTTAIAPGDVVRFLEVGGHPPRIVDIPERAG